MISVFCPKRVMFAWLKIIELIGTVIKCRYRSHYGII